MPTQRKLSLLGLSLIVLAPGFVSLASSRPGAGFPPSGPPSTAPRRGPGLSPEEARQLVEAGRKRVEQRGEELERARL